jgi:spore coat protein U-like protein
MNLKCKLLTWHGQQLSTWLAVLALLLTTMFFQTAAQAAISCSISAPGIISGYQPNSPTIIITQASYSITCTRGLVTDPTTTTYSVKVNNGLQPTGQNNNAVFGINKIRYDFYTNSACGTQWKGNTTIPSPAGTITMSGLTSTTVTQSFWSCLPAGQAPAAGTYTDTVTMTPTYSAGVVGGTGSAAVTIITPAVCTISSAPGTVGFGTYVALGGSITANTTFGSNCSNSLPYTMSLDANSGVAVGLNYTLLLSTTSSGGSSTLNSTGTGAAQTFFINGTMAAGQAGTCPTGTCAGTNTHTLTITY